jgi:hypothetical protein
LRRQESDPQAIPEQRLSELGLLSRQVDGCEIDRVDRDQLMVAPERRARDLQCGLERGRRLVVSPLVAQNP